MDIWWAITWILVMLMVLGAVFFVIYVKKIFVFKLKYWEVSGNTNKAGYSIDTLKGNRVRWNKNRTKWILLHPLFRSKSILPFEADSIYPGKNLYAFKFGDEYVPAKIHLSDVDKGIIFPVPSYVKEWHSQQLENNVKEFASQSFWEKNKSYIVMIITIIACCALVGIVCWYTLRYASGVKEGLGVVGKAIQGLQTVGGMPPS